MNSAFDDKRAGDADALALAAGELVRILVAVGRIEADQRSSSPTRAAISVALSGQPEGADRLGDDAVHPPARVEAGVGVLEDHLHAPAQLLALGARAPAPTCRRRRS